MDSIMDSIIATSNTNNTGSNDNNIDYYNNFIVFNVDHLNRAFTITIVFIWSLYFVISRPVPPQPPPPVIKCNMISSRGIGIILLLISMALEMISDLIAFANSNDLTSSSSQDILSGAPLIITLILWNTALALKSVALFISLTRYAPLTRSLSKEPIMPKFQYSCCNCLNFFSGLIVYPVLFAVILLSRARWEEALTMSQLFFLLQLIIAEIMFLIINKRMTIALEEGMLMGRNAIQQIRKLRSRNWFIIIFAFVQICSLSVYNIDLLTGNVIRTNFAATVIILGIMDIGSALLYGAIALLLCPVYPQSGEGMPINSVMTHHIAGYTHGLNNFANHRSSQISFDQNQINRDNLEDQSCASSINDKSKRNSAIIINKIVVHKQEILENTQEIQPLEGVVISSDKSHRFSNTIL
ncbi:12213_t:CDS:2 [Dentiscutata erythropus]|uniref:12213_t:CDS:1 n=1 Tax=Dentiscutata erythropus TaxID=1348616 RepID=A0A9N9A260_9GLOM|nr:12213_t:CDS:2 [Dentiscutata erythropus]